MFLASPSPTPYPVAMFASLRGRILEKTATWLLLEVAGIGYRVMASPAVISIAKAEGEAFFYIHDHIREDAHDLFGFLSLNDLELFEKLLSISGVGPKSAMTIMAVGTANQVREAIMKGDLETLTSVPGVGKKTAQKIILELKGQLVEPEEGSSEGREAQEALLSLGYPAAEAKAALKAVDTSIKGTSDRVREALKYLNKHR